MSLYAVSSQLIHTSINRTSVSHLQNKTTVVNKHETTASKLSLFYLIPSHKHTIVYVRVCARVYVRAPSIHKYLFVIFSCINLYICIIIIDKL